MRRRCFASLLMPVCLVASPASDTAMNRMADAYVRLVLVVGRHDDSFVDAYYGPKALKEEAAKGAPIPQKELRRRTQLLLKRLKAQPASPRRTFLEKQLVAVDAFLRRLGGEKMTLAQEARLLYDIEIPAVSMEEVAAARAQVETLIPGEGSLESRVAALQARFYIPKGKLQAAVDAALEELRKRTATILTLPAGERFRSELVKEKPWGGYNWYEGNLSSLIQINTDLPMALDRLLPLLAHEGYPGHHVFNSLLESKLVRGKGWSEFTVYPLHSPQSLIAEGTADAAMGMVLTDAEHRAFLKNVLAPLVGLDTADLDRYLDVQKALGTLGRARGEATRMQLEEGRPESETVDFLVKQALMTPERARKALEFSRINRSYIFTYTVGKDLVEAYAGSGPDRVTRFVGLLSRPVTPSELVKPR